METEPCLGATDENDMEVPLVRVNAGKLQYNSAGTRANQNWVDFTTSAGSLTLTDTGVHDFYFELFRENASTINIVGSYKDNSGVFSFNDGSIAATTTSLVFTTINSSAIEEAGYRFEAANSNTYTTHGTERDDLLGYTETELFLNHATLTTTHHATRRTITGDFDFSGNLFNKGQPVGTSTPVPIKNAHFGTAHLESETESGLRDGNAYSRFLMQDNTAVDTAIHYDVATMKLPITGGIEYNNNTGEFQLKAGVWLLCSSAIVNNQVTGNGNNNRLVPELRIRQGQTNVRHISQSYSRWNDPTKSVTPDNGGAGAGTGDSDRVSRLAFANAKMSVSGTIISEGTELNSVRLHAVPQGSAGFLEILSAHTHLIYYGVGEEAVQAALKAGSTFIYGSL